MALWKGIREFLTGGRKEDPTYSAYTQFLGIGSPIYTPRNYTSLAKEGYEKNITVYRSVSLIAQSCAGIPWKLYRTGGVKNIEVTSHPILDLLAYPNPQNGTSSFIEDMISFWLIAGNSYVICVRPRPGAPPREMWVLRPDRISIVPGPFNISGYDYSLDGHRQFFLQEDMLHLKMFAANNDWYGLSPVSVAAALIDQQNEGFDWNTAILQNMGRPSGALVATGVLGNDQYERLRKLIRERYTGKKNAGMPMLLEGGLDWKQFSMSPLELDWMESRKQNMRDISIALGVPPELLGDSANKTYCLPYETQVMTPSGPVAIGEIRPGREVYTLEKDGEMGVRTVLKQSQTGFQALHRITCGKHEISATGNHPFLVFEDGTYHYKIAAKLNLGDFLVRACWYPHLNDSCGSQISHWFPDPPQYCEIVQVTKLEMLPSEPVYDIEVEGSHNFFAEHFCVHNSNYQEARKSFYQETVLPLMDKLTSRLNVWLVPMFEDGLELRYDKEEVEALQEDRQSLSSRLLGQWNAGLITLNEVRDQLGLSELPGGDILQILVQGHVYIPSDQLEQYVEAKLENLLAPPPPPQPGAPAPDLHLPDNGTGPEENTPTNASLTADQPAKPKPPGNQGGANPGQANPAYSGVPTAADDDDQPGGPWEGNYSARNARERKENQLSGEQVMQSALAHYFREERAALLASLKNVSVPDAFVPKIEKVLKARLPLLQDVLQDQYRLLGKKRATEVWEQLKMQAKATKKPASKKPKKPDQDAIDALDAWLQEHPVDLADSGDIYTLYDPNFDPTQDEYWNAATEKYFAQFAFKRVSGISSTTLDILRRSVSDGLSQNETPSQLVGRIDALYQSSIIPNRSKTIALTELTAALNFGGRVVAISAGVPINKSWAALQDGKTRPGHAQAHGQTTDLYDPYEVDGEQLMYPGDISLNASAKNTVNCRCGETFTQKTKAAPLPLHKEQKLPVIVESEYTADSLFVRHPVVLAKQLTKPYKSQATNDFKALRDLAERRLETQRLKHYPGAHNQQNHGNRYGKPESSPLDNTNNLDKVAKLSEDYTAWRKSLSSDERSGIEHYTSSEYADINGALRNGDTSDSYIQNQIKNISSALAKGSAPYPFTVNRGMGFSSKEEYDSFLNMISSKGVGSVFSDKAFTSTTSDGNAGFGWVSDYQLKLQIHVPKGSAGGYVRDMSFHPAENEFLLPAGSKFKILGIEKEKSFYGDNETTYIKVGLLKTRKKKS